MTKTYNLSAVVEHALTNNHEVNWTGVRVIDITGK